MARTALALAGSSVLLAVLASPPAFAGKVSIDDADAGSEFSHEVDYV